MDDQKEDEHAENQTQQAGEPLHCPCGCVEAVLHDLILRRRICASAYIHTRHCKESEQKVKQKPENKPTILAPYADSIQNVDSPS